MTQAYFSVSGGAKYIAVVDDHIYCASLRDDGFTLYTFKKINVPRISKNMNEAYIPKEDADDIKMFARAYPGEQITESGKPLDIIRKRYVAQRINEIVAAEIARRRVV